MGVDTEVCGNGDSTATVDPWAAASAALTVAGSGAELTVTGAWTVEESGTTAKSSFLTPSAARSSSGILTIRSGMCKTRLENCSISHR